MFLFVKLKYAYYLAEINVFEWVDKLYTVPSKSKHIQKSDFKLKDLRLENTLPSLTASLAFPSHFCGSCLYSISL